MSINLNNKKEYKVGIPRGLLFYKYFPLWAEMLTEMGCKIVVSPETNKEIMELGSDFSDNDLCVPVKIFYGQVLYILKNYHDLDYIFIPRYMSLKKANYFCPKLITLPDIIKKGMNSPIPVLEFYTNVKERTEVEGAIEMGEILGVGRNDSMKAFFHAEEKLKEFRHILMEGKIILPDLLYEKYGQFLGEKKKETKNYESKDGDAGINQKFPLTFLVLGHPYNTYESIINQNFLKRLEHNYVNVKTSENLPKEHYYKEVQLFPEKFGNHWDSVEDMLIAAQYYLTEEGLKEIDGVIFLISFACGPDSLIQELVVRKFKKTNMPVLSLILDEHSGESGIVTRVETFIDMVRRKKFKDKGL
ncbi:MAG: hypothetical protein GY870_17830 [archaeon]|nr:hypothetical protein [archaeon]